MRKGLDALYLLSGWAAAFLIVAICTLVMAQVSLNLADKIAIAFTGTAIGMTIPSYADFTGFFLASASFLALAHTLRAGGHIRVTLVLQKFPPRVAHFAEIWCVAVAAAIALYFTFFMLRLTHESFLYNDLSAGMIAVPIWIPQSGMLIGLAVLSIALIDELIGLLAGGKASYADKGENLLADAEEAHRKQKSDGGDTNAAEVKR
jgi:TRAP-type C4-dicarboxylate transport system permease small subunit